MKKKIAQMRLSMIASLFVIMLLLISFSSATFAWFSFGAATNVEPLSSTISKGDISLLIANKVDGTYAASTRLILDKEIEVLKPVSTGDLREYYTAIGHNSDGVSVLFQKKEEPEVLHGMVYLKCIYGDADVYFYQDELNFGSSEQARSALRLGLRIVTADQKVYENIFRLDALVSGAVTSQQTVPQPNTVIGGLMADSTALFVPDPSVDIGQYLSKGVSDDIENGRKKLCTIKQDEVASVEYWLYLEGCDENCINEIQSKEIDLQLSFAGFRTKD